MVNYKKHHLYYFDRVKDPYVNRDSMHYTWLGLSEEENMNALGWGGVWRLNVRRGLRGNVLPDPVPPWIDPGVVDVGVYGSKDGAENHEDKQDYESGVHRS